MTDILELRATVAKTSEDLRIARKHEAEAAARTFSPANRRAYQSARGWTDVCAEADRQARVALIAAQAADGEFLPSIAEAMQLALGELGEASMKDGDGCYAAIDRAKKLLSEANASLTDVLADAEMVA